MVRKLAIDWDDSELRLVAAQCNGRSVKVTDASVIPVENTNVLETLKAAIKQRGLENTHTLVAIGRGKAELRELQLPPVPDEELPDMVRFQAIRSFATAGDNAIVDYLVTNRSESGVEMIAAAVGPQNLSEIQKTCEGVELNTKRISLRPLAAAALYLINRSKTVTSDTVLVDLLADDAEIVVARDGKVIFVRTVRLPPGDASRCRALAGELRRSLVACGSSGSLDRVVLWGREAVHAEDVAMLAEATDSKVEVLDPFTLVDVDRQANSNMPDHVGRLAPLVGLLVADDTDAERLVDFLNPRERVEEAVNPYRPLMLAAIPVAAVALLAFIVFRQLNGLDYQIAELKAANASMNSAVDQANESLARTETVDKFLDGDVNWLDEIRRLARQMPPSDELIVRSVSATSDLRTGGGTLTIDGAVTKPGVIDRFEDALRDEFHAVKGDGASVQKTEDAYRWGFTEAIKISPVFIRNQRYAAMIAPSAAEAGAMETPLDATGSEEIEVGSTASVDSSQVADETPVEDRPPDEMPDVGETSTDRAAKANRESNEDSASGEPSKDQPKPLSSDATENSEGSPDPQSSLDDSDTEDEATKEAESAEDSDVDPVEEVVTEIREEVQS